MSNERGKPWYKKPAIIAAIIGAVALIAAAIIQIYPPIPEPPEFVTVVGRVTQDGTPVAGVNVIIDGQSGITGADGRYVISNVPAGTLKVLEVRTMETKIFTDSIEIEKGLPNKRKTYDVIISPTPTETPPITLTPTPIPIVPDKIGITLEIRGNTAYGTVTGVSNYDDYRVVVYVETNKLYVQPVIDPPSARYRVIESDGSWDCSGMHIEYGGVVRAFLIEEGSNAPNTLPIGADPDGVVARARKIL